MLGRLLFVHTCFSDSGSAEVHLQSRSSLAVLPSRFSRIKGLFLAVPFHPILPRTYDPEVTTQLLPKRRSNTQISA